jgi:hypothetical protein
LTYHQRGQPEIKADNWPARLEMHLKSKDFFNTVCGKDFKICRRLSFQPRSGELPEILINAMNAGFFGFIDFGFFSTCDIKTIILIYQPKDKMLYGFIPNQQLAFRDRILKLMSFNNEDQPEQKRQRLGEFNIISGSFCSKLRIF